MGCEACEVVAPGGVIAETGGWVVDHTVGPLGLGTLIVKPRRHVLSVADLTPAEAAELGPLLQRSAAVVRLLSQPDQVYVCLWSHAGREPGHIHFVVQPVTQDILHRYDLHGPRLQAALFEAGEVATHADAAAFAAAARDAF